MTRYLFLNRLGDCNQRTCNRRQTQKGVASVEFAFIAPVFLALLFSIFEAAFFFFVSSAVQLATDDASRLVRTGQATAGFTRDEFFDEVCDVVKVFGDCDERLTIEVDRFATFTALAADTAPPVCRDADDGAVNGLAFNTGAGREIIRVRVCFLHSSISPGIGLNFDQTGDGQAKIVSTAIFRNESF